MFLWHFPVILFFTSRKRLPELLVPALCLPISLALAALSWRAVERPVQAWARRVAAGQTRRGGVVIADRAPV